MNRKEKILAYIHSAEYIPLKFTELTVVLSVPKEDEGEFEGILKELCTEGKIFETKKGRYAPVSGGLSTAAGRLVCNEKGYFGFVICDDENSEDIFIPGDDMGQALNGDRVLVKFDTNGGMSRHHREGRVIKVLERGNKIIVGVIYKKKDRYLYMRPDSRKIYTKICIGEENSMTAQIGDRAAAEITGYDDNGMVFGEIASVLGREDDLKSCVEGIIISEGIKQEFDIETLREADKIPQSVSAEMTKDREDLRDMLIFTIDGDDARDFDDAVSLTITENGNYCLGVHIADVSEYVREGSSLDSEAYERGTSVYLADRVIPMLPEKLSNGICSLNPNADRLTLSVFMEITGDGTVMGHRLCKSVIRSKERMTYNNVNSILEGEDETLCARYKYMLPTLKSMETLAETLRSKRAVRGSINFDFPESRVIADENGIPVEIVREIRGVSNKMIEEFMLAANETIAEYAFWSEIPFVYRNHAAPSADKIAEFNEFIRRFGLSIKGKIDRDNPIHPKALQRILDEVKDTPQERIVSSTMLRSLMKAEYSGENLGHFGLAAKYYCHFTSPIRRYPDLAIHRILKDFIDGNLRNEKISYLKGYTFEAAVHSSEREATAEHAERDVEDLMKAAYMSRFIGERFDGIVANVTGFGMFVELDNSVEGLVRAENMTDDYYEFDEHANALIGRRKNNVYTTGDCVRVVLARADVISRQIDFVLEKDADDNILKKIGAAREIPKRAEKKTKNKTKRGKKYKRRKKH